jgi:hypothetical protein
MRIGPLSRAHSIVGWLGFLAFLGSGLHLLRPELASVSEVTRALSRANHLYLLAAALLNLLAAKVGPAPGRLRGRLRIAGSFVLLPCVPVLAAAFWREPQLGFAGRQLTLLGNVLALAGTLLLVLTTPKGRDG